MTIQVIDNFLPTSIFEKIKFELCGSELAWYYNNTVTDSDEILEYDSTWCWQLTHTFYSNYSIVSDKFFVLEPLIIQLNPVALIRVKANLMPRTQEIIEHKMHVDAAYAKTSGKTAVFYLNTNNGYTIFKNGKKVASVENRILIFDSTLEHTGTSCTNAKNRCVLNLNYYI